MGALLSKWWFKWVALSLSTILFVTVIFGSVAKEKWRQYKVEQEKQRVLEERRAFEDSFRSSMSRIYQNLKLDHYLAAYKNLELFNRPDSSDKLLAQEYVDVLYRIGDGLFQTNFLKESEEVFQLIRSYDGQLDQSGRALTKIESKRRFESGRLLIDTGKELLAQERYRDAAAEFKKAEIELNSVELVKSEEVRRERERMFEGSREARFHVYLKDARLDLDEAAKSLGQNQFREVHKALAKAAQNIGRAAFIKPDSPLVSGLRNELLGLDTELSVRVPNQIPIYNKFERELLGRLPSFLYVHEIKFDTSLETQGKVGIHLKYQRRHDGKAYLLRYRIYFEKGRDIFNGFKLESNPEGDDLKPIEVSFEQAIPERFKGQRIMRIEVNIYEPSNEIVSRVMRAFRT